MACLNIVNTLFLRGNLITVHVKSLVINVANHNIGKGNDPANIKYMFPQIYK